VAALFGKHERKRLGQEKGDLEAARGRQKGTNTEREAIRVGIVGGKLLFKNQFEGKQEKQLFWP